jgi:predicted dithiol-disulfide oxidoreductase (DUF899 family)
MADLPEIVPRQQWLAARKELLADEKALTRTRDQLSTKRRGLPMVLIDTEYEFEGTTGTVSLLDLFEGRRQLIMQHFMFDPEWDDGCPSCTAGSDEISDGLLRHLHARDTTLVVVSRAPLAKIEDYRARRGWTFPWHSSFASPFNCDFHVTLDNSVAPVEFNYRDMSELSDVGMERMAEGSWEQPGYSTFLRDGDDVFHTYSTFARGTEMLGGSYYFLDLTALGRQEEWEEPKGRVDTPGRAEPNFVE